jgi:hypothetical protein
MHPIQTATKIKMGTLAMHRSKKPYVHAIMKNEALLDAEMEWGRMTPSPNEIVRGKDSAKRGGKKREKAAMNLPQVVAMALEICRNLPPYDTGSCRFLSQSAANTNPFNFQVLLSVVCHRCIMLSVDDRTGTTKTRRQGVPQYPGTAL